MPRHFDNPIGGFTRGFTGGAQLGLQIQEQKAKVDARLGEIQKEKFTKAKAGADFALKLFGNKDLPNKTRLDAYNSQIRPFLNNFVIGEGGQGVPELDALPNFSAEVAKRLEAINKLEVPDESKRQMVIDLLPEFGEDFEKFLTEKAKGFGEAGVLGREIAKEERGVDREIAKEERKPPTPTSIEGLVLEKARKEGLESLTPVEAQIYKGATEGKGADITVNLGLEKGVKGAIEKDIIAAQKQIGQLDRAEDLFQDDYLTVIGKGQAGLERIADKLGFGTPPEYLKARTRWKAIAKQSFLAYRKWVTGVAGGEKEMADIAKAYPDPDKNSPTEYRANFEESRQWARALSVWLKETKEQGLSIQETRELFGDDPVDPATLAAKADPQDLRGMLDATNRKIEALERKQRSR